MKWGNWKPGSWNAICDRCGFQYKAEELFETYDGLRVCKVRGCFEFKHPLEMERPYTRVPEKLEYVRPDREHPEIEVTINPNALHCSVNGVYCQADIMEADCAIVGEYSGAFLSTL